MGEVPLAVSFPDLFRCARNQSAKVIDYMVRTNDSIILGSIFRRSLNEREETEFRSMLVLIGTVFIPRNGGDRKVLMALTNGMFSVASVFLAMTRDAPSSHSQVANLWKIKALPRAMHLGGRRFLEDSNDG